MSYEVFETTPEGADALADDDLVSRQTLVVRDGDEWGLDAKVVLVEGNEDAIDQARSIIEEKGGAPSENAEEIKADIDSEQDSAAAGVGNLFG